MDLLFFQQFKGRFVGSLHHLGFLRNLCVRIEFEMYSPVAIYRKSVNEYENIIRLGAGISTEFGTMESNTNLKCSKLILTKIAHCTLYLSKDTSVI